MTTARVTLLRLGLGALVLALLLGLVLSPGGDTCGTLFMPQTSYVVDCAPARAPYKLVVGLVAVVGAVLLAVRLALPRTTPGAPETTKRPPATREG